MAKTRRISVKQLAIMDADMILQDSDAMPKLQRWYYNKEICGTVDAFFNRYFDPSTPFSDPDTVADLIERFQFPFNPSPEFSGARKGDGGYPDNLETARRYYRHFFWALFAGLQATQPTEDVCDGCGRVCDGNMCAACTEARGGTGV